MKHTPTFPWMEIATGAALLSLCLLVAGTQFVNPFPHDGWFESQYRLFGRFPGADNYSPIAAPALLYASVHQLAVLTGHGLEAEFYLGSLLQNLMVFSPGCSSGSPTRNWDCDAADWLSLR